MPNNIYAKVGESFFQSGGICPDGWVEMTAERSNVLEVAQPDGTWSIPLSALEKEVRMERNRRVLCALDAKAKYEREQTNLSQDPPIAVANPMTEVEYKEVLQYTQNLFEFPEQEGFPWNGVVDAPWPTKPACVCDCSII